MDERRAIKTPCVPDDPGRVQPRDGTPLFFGGDKLNPLPPPPARTRDYRGGQDQHRPDHRAQIRDSHRHLGRARLTP
ncbi:hypothetical protein GCM10020220_104170 [Nonomuraea rubra]